MSTMTESGNIKIALIGGGGLRTPLLIFGIQESAHILGPAELALYDPDADRVRIMAELGRALVAREEGSLRIRIASSAQDAIADASFVLNSIRVGGIGSRALDEKTAVDHGYPGQETTGPGGVAMALRTIPAALAYARLVEQLSPDAWLINFTNPAGLITQAISQATGTRVVGICDTPDELFHRIATALHASAERVRCDYLGLNHLGWVRRVYLDGKDVTTALLEDDSVLDQLYPGSLFDHELLRCLQLLPTEYLYFYYSRRRALANQCAVGTTRGEEVARLNERLLSALEKHLQSGNSAEALTVYTAYLNQRSNSYMKLEADRGSAFQDDGCLGQDPFRSATGYHRIALNVMKALCGLQPQRIVVNVPNQGAITDIVDPDIVEVPCTISRNSIQPEACGRLPEAVRGLVLAVKAYEHTVTAAAVSGSAALARKAMLLYPAIGEWEPSKDLLEDMIDHNPSLEYLNNPGRNRVAT
jgi:6-phospho-beta-glucosidase